MEDDITVESAMDAVYAAQAIPAIDDGEFTVRQYAEHHGLPLTTASRHLERAEAAGVLSSRTVLFGGHRCKAYRIVVQ